MSEIYKIECLLTDWIVLFEEEDFFIKITCDEDIEEIVETFIEELLDNGHTLSAGELKLRFNGSEEVLFWLTEDSPGCFSVRIKEDENMEYIFYGLQKK